MTKHVLGIIDAQRGFMPESEGQRLGVAGFGELTVPHGEKIVPNICRLLNSFAMYDFSTFTTQDWHPTRTAHFSQQPDFANTWPRHCVAATPGAELHPYIELPSTNRSFVKGTEPLRSGKEDTSYSAYYAHHRWSDERLPDWLAKVNTETVYLGGLALEECVGKSALDLKKKVGVNVTVVTDATAGIAPVASRRMLQEFERAGVRTATTEQVIRAVARLATGQGRA